MWYLLDGLNDLMRKIEKKWWKRVNRREKKGKWEKGNKYGKGKIDRTRSNLYFWPTPVKYIFNFFWNFVRENSRLENNFDRTQIWPRSVKFDDVIETCFGGKFPSIFCGARHLKFDRINLTENGQICEQSKLIGQY